MQYKQKLLNKENNWSELRNYKPNDVVSDDGKLWQNISGINSKPGSISNNDWVVIDDSIDYAKIDFVNDEIDKIKEFATVGIVGSINPNTDTTNLTDGVYNAQISGTYPNASNIVVKEGYYTLLRKTADVWSLESEVEMPMQDLSVIESEINNINEVINDNSFKSKVFEEKYDSSSALNGFYNGTGVFTANADFKCTPKIPVAVSEKWRYRGGSVNAITANRVYGYKADNSVIVLVASGNTTPFVDFTIPSGIVSIVANYNITTSTNYNIQKEVDENVFVKIETENDIVKKINDVNYKFFNDTQLLETKSIVDSNITNEYTYTEKYDTTSALNGFYNGTGVFTSNTDFKCTPKIPVIEGDKYRYRGKSYGGAYTVNAIYGYKADNSVVVILGVVNATTYSEVTIPSGVVNIVANYYIQNALYYNIQKINTIAKFVAFQKDSLGNITSLNGNEINKFITGKSIASVGDSITANGVNVAGLNGYQKQLQNYFTFSKYTTYGYSGQALATFVTVNGVSIIEQFINNSVTHDVFTLLAGTNDFRNALRLGTIEDYHALTTYKNEDGSFKSMNFYQALKAFVLRCYELNPQAKIILFTQLQRDNAGYTSISTNSLGNKLSDYVNAIRLVAEYESLPIVDLWKESSINMKNITQYTSDGLHPIDNGYKLITNLLKPAISKVL